MTKKTETKTPLEIYVDGLDALVDGRGFGAQHEAARQLLEAAPDAAVLLERILGMHLSGNNGLYNGEAILSRSVADEIAGLLKRAGVKLPSWMRETLARSPR